jgi:hypothetical protein
MIRPCAAARALALVLAALCFAGAAATPALAKKKPPVVVAPPPPPPPEPEIPVGPPVMAGYLIDTASAFATFVRTASGMNATFPDGPSISSALKVGAVAEQHQLQQGVVAYAAIVALQDQTFVETVRGFAKHASTRDMMVRYIMDNPAYVMTLAGHDTAAARVTAAIGSQALRLKLTADQIKQESYNIQLTAAWSKKPVPDPMGRLATIKQLSSLPIVGAEDLKAQLAGAAVGSAPLPGDSSPQPPVYTDAVARGLAVAALAVLGKAGDGDLAALLPLLNAEGDSYCFNMSKLNLYQCLSVARPYYEDLYCLGLHGMGDLGRCMMNSVGMAEPAALPPTWPALTKVSTKPRGKAPARRRRH